VTCSLAEAVDTPDVRLARVFSDHGVLQRGRPLPVWGWAVPGAQVEVALAGQKRSVAAGADGRWMVTFDALQSGQAPLELVAISGGSTARAGDLLVGEVWVCSGQSNMEMSTSSVRDGQQEISTASGFPTIRLLNVDKKSTVRPRTDIDDTWTVCNPKSVARFSAVGYFFGRELQRGLQVPVGLIHSSWSGTPAQSWTSCAALTADPKLVGYVKTLDDALAASASHDEQITKAKLAAKDGTGWEKPDVVMSEWKAMDLPQYWEKAGLNIDGVVWFRQVVDIPAAAAGKDLTLGLGPIDNEDTTWWDGEKIGGQKAWTVPREYTVPARLVTPGRHVIAVRVVDANGGGGIYGQARAAGCPAWQRCDDRAGRSVAILCRLGAPRAPRLVRGIPTCPPACAMV